MDKPHYLPLTTFQVKLPSIAATRGMATRGGASRSSTQPALPQGARGILWNDEVYDDRPKGPDRPFGPTRPVHETWRAVMSGGDQEEILM